MGGRGGANLSAKRDVAGGGGGARADEGIAALAALVVFGGILALGVGTGGVGGAMMGGVLSVLGGDTFFNGVDAAFRGSGVACALAGNFAGVGFLAGGLALRAVLDFGVFRGAGAALEEDAADFLAAGAALAADFRADLAGDFAEDLAGDLTGDFREDLTAALAADFLAVAFPAKVLVTEISSQQRHTPG